MKLFNILPTVQGVRVKDAGRFYTVYVEPKSTIEIDNKQLTNDIMERIQNSKLRVLSDFVPVEGTNTVNTVVVDEIPVEQVSVEETESQEETVIEETESQEETVIEEISQETVTEEVISEVFKCDICGNEFASQRGLDMHIAKSHKEE